MNQEMQKPEDDAGSDTCSKSGFDPSYLGWKSGSDSDPSSDLSCFDAASRSTKDCDEASSQTGIDEASFQTEIDEASSQTGIDEASFQTEIDEASFQTEIDEASSQTGIDEASFQTEIDEGSYQTEIDEASPQTEIDESDVETPSVQPKHGKIDFWDKFQPIVLLRRLPLFKKCKAKLVNGTVTIVFDDQADSSQQLQILPKLVPKPKRAIKEEPKSNIREKRQKKSDASSSDCY